MGGKRREIRHRGVPEPIEANCGLIEYTREGPVVTVTIDGRPSSALDVDDPTHLPFLYMQVMDALAAGLLDPSAALRPAMLHLGGCGCALPRAWVARWPAARQVVAEIDPDMVAAARAWFDLPKKPALSLRCQDARAAIDEAPEGRYLAVVRDTFADGVCPAALADREAWAGFARVLAPGGLVLANSTGGLGAAKAQAARAVAAGFGWVRLAGTRRALTAGKSGNIVIAARACAPEETGIRRALARCGDPCVLLEA